MIVRSTLSLLFLFSLLPAPAQTCAELNNQAVPLKKDGRYDTAIVLLKQAIAVCDVEEGQYKECNIIHLNNLADCYHHTGRSDEAIALYQETLQQTERKYGREHFKYGQRILKLAEVSAESGDFQEALTLIEEGYAVGSKLVPDDIRLVNWFRDELDDVLELLNDKYHATAEDWEEAVPYYLAGISIYENNGGKENSSYLYWQNSLAQLYYINGRYSEVLPLYQEDLYLTQKMWPDSEHHAIALYNLSQLHGLLGFKDSAFSYGQKALSVIEDTVGTNNRNYIILLANVAGTYSDIGRFSDALATYEEVLHKTELVLGKDHRDFAAYVHGLAVLNLNMGRFKEALRLMTGIIEREQSTGDTLRPEYAMMLSVAAQVYEGTGSYSNAIALHERALLVIEKSLGKNHPDYYLHLLNLGRSFATSRQFTKASEILLQALKSIEIFLGTEDLLYHTALVDLARIRTDQGEFAEANALWSDILKRTEQTFGKQNLEYASCLYDLSDFYQTAGLLDQAVEAASEAVKIVEEIAGNNHPDYGLYAGRLGVLYGGMGKYDEALPLFEKELANRRSLYGPTHWAYANSLSNAGDVVLDLEQYEKALSLYQEALRIYDTTFGRSSEEYATGLVSLAYANYRLGRYDAAMSMAKQAVQITDSISGKESPAYILAVDGLARVYQSTGQQDMAVPLYQECLRLLRNNSGVDHPNYAIVLNNLAGLYRDMERHEEAAALYEESLDKIGATLGEDHNEYANSLDNLAEVYVGMGEFGRALPLFEKALVIMEKGVGPNNSAYGMTLASLAKVHWYLGDHEQAFRYYEQATSNFNKKIASVFQFSNEQDKAAFLAQVSDHYQVGQSIWYQTKGESADFQELLYNNQLVQKGRLLNSTKALLQVVRNSSDTNVARVHKEWVNAKRLLASAYSRGNDIHSSGTKELEKEVNDLETKLVSLSKDFRIQQEQIEVTSERVHDHLKEGEMAIEFSAFQYFNKEWKDSTVYVAYILTPALPHPKPIFLFEEKQLNALLSSGHPNLLYAARGDTIDLQLDYATAGEELYKLIVGPLEPYLQDVHTIYFSPDGKLHQLAFAALSDSTGTLLIDRYNLVQLSSTSNLVTPAEAPEAVPALFFGGIDYSYIPAGDKDTAAFTYSPLANNTQKRSNNTRGSSWNYLPGTAKEVKVLSSLYVEQEFEATIISRENATEEYFKSLDGNSPSILHVATHGFFFEAPEKQVEKSNQQSAYKLSDDPLMRSGLVLAGANYTWKHGSNPYEKEDGILTAYEISHLDLSNTDLVVLSACETGLGDIEGSEGVYGLQRAFRMAGVDYLIMSLWEVPDEETAQFMYTFYDLWLSGTSIREAFSQTQHLMSQRYRYDPEKWAAFVLVE